MRQVLVTLVLLLVLSGLLNGQTKAELEEQRKKTLEDIAYMDNMLRRTAEEKSQGMSELNMINRKLALRENVIGGIKEEINLLQGRIELNTLAREMMEDDLEKLIKDYEKAILNAQRASKGQPDVAYIFSARDLNQGYKRMKYLQQVARSRRREAELIGDLKEEISKNNEQLQVDLEEVGTLKSREEAQKLALEREQRSKRQVINGLSRKQSQLQKDLEQKRKIALEIEKEIARIVEEERRRRVNVELTPEEKLLGDDFEKNRGLLPWPVETGVITSQFGIHDHPVFKGTKVDNIGIEITSGQKVSARTVFKGKVMSVFGISGGNMAVIVRHGSYLTVYQNLINVTVKPGDDVGTKQKLGDVFPDASDSGKCTLKFMIYAEKEKKNPEEWLAKKR